MLSHGPGAAWLQEAHGQREASKRKEQLAQRKKNDRAKTVGLFAKLELMTPSVDKHTGQRGYRSKALRGRAKDTLLLDIMHAVRRRLEVPGALHQAYTTQAGAGLIAFGLKSGSIVHQSPSFQDLTSWIPAQARGNIRVCLEARDGDDLHTFCQSVVRDAGELSPDSETFRELNKVVGRSVTVRFLTRAPGPPGLRNPQWLLLVRAVKLTLVGVHGGSPAAGMRLPFFGQARIPEAIGVFTADLSGGMPPQWTVQAAHVRNLLDLEVAPGTYDMDTGNMKPLEQIAMLFANFEFSKEGGGGDSVFSRAGFRAQMEYAATSALNIAQRSASWLTRKALRIHHQWSVSLNEDDSVSISGLIMIRLLGGLSTSLAQATWWARLRSPTAGSTCPTLSLTP
ncbi:hypothetical protein T484DRAFT_1916223, partial [Baffinella frigidus]